MSYILDALRRADSERTRGAVPGLHAQPTAALPPSPAAPRSALPFWLGAGAVLLGAGGVAAWHWLAPREAAAPAAAAAAAAGAVQTPMPVPVPMPAAPSPPVATAPASPPVAAPPVVAAPPSAPPAPRAAPPSTASAAAPLPPPPSRPAASPPPAPAAPAAAVAPAERIHTLQELPDDIRRQLPALTVSGAVHSNDPAQRMLIVNGQVVQEGGQPAPEVSLLQIGPKAAVLGFRGYRFSVSY